MLALWLCPICPLIWSLCPLHNSCSDIDTNPSHTCHTYHTHCYWLACSGLWQVGLARVKQKLVNWWHLYLEVSAAALMNTNGCDCLSWVFLTNNFWPPVGVMWSVTISGHSNIWPPTCVTWLVMISGHSNFWPTVGVMWYVTLSGHRNMAFYDFRPHQLLTIIWHHMACHNIRSCQLLTTRRCNVTHKFLISRSCHMACYDIRWLQLLTNGGCHIASPAIM